jgi:hypothetical protein
MHILFVRQDLQAGPPRPETGTGSGGARLPNLTGAVLIDLEHDLHGDTS